MGGGEVSVYLAPTTPGTEYGMKEHWNKKYTNDPITQLGWYESRSFPSIQLIEKCALPKHSPIVDVG